MAWNIEGVYFENCNCNVICPCITTDALGPADNDTCDFVMAYHIDSGNVNGTDVGGRDVAVIGRAPGVMTEGNWKVALIIDDKASEAETDALTGVFGGQLGGPMGALAPLIGEFLGVERAPFSYDNDGARHAVTIGSLADVAITDYVPPGMSGPMQLTGVGHPVSSTLTVARSELGKVNVLGLSFDNTGKNGHAASVSWSG